jgi:hypothetical protein
VYGLSATQFSPVFALNAAGMIGLGLLNARLVRGFPVRSLLVIGLMASTGAAVILFGVVAGTSLGLVAALPPLFLVVASRGLLSASATVLRVKRAPAAGAASAVLGACMFGGGIPVSPLPALGGEGTAVPMAAVVAGGAVAARLTTVVLTRGDHPAPGSDLWRRLGPGRRASVPGRARWRHVAHRRRCPADASARAGGSHAHRLDAARLRAADGWLLGVLPSCVRRARRRR